MTSATKQNLNQLLQSGRTLISTDEAASILNLKPQTLYRWACYQCGPVSSVHVGRSLKWRLNDIASLVG